MALVVFSCLLLIVATTLTHYEVLNLLTRLLDRLCWPGRAKLIDRKSVV